MTQDPWDFVHITCWNFLPFLLKRVGVAPAWAVRIAFAVWFAGLAALAATLSVRLALRPSTPMPQLHRIAIEHSRYPETMPTAYIGLGANLPSHAGPPQSTLAAASCG